MSAPTGLPNDAANRDFPDKDANKEGRGHAQTLSDVFLSAKENIMNTTAGVGCYGTTCAESVESGLSELETLFNHPLYNMPRPPIPEEDWLLKAKSMVEASEKSSQMWSVF